jgi:membrane-associated phospholipid phosphatase
MTVASGIALHLGPDGPGASDARWRGGILFDERFRSAVRLAAVDDQEIARTISDITLGAAILNAAAVDAVAIPLAQGDTDLAWRASLAHALAQGLTLSIGEVVKRGSERARPFERECANDPQRAGCSDSDRFHSFFSLHTGMAFTSAGFSCAMHSARPLYQDVAADASSCLASIALASTTGLLRVASDRHYLSDVLVGAALGFAIGYLVPLAIVPERRAAPGDEGPVQNWAVAPMLAPGTDGSSMASGTFGLSVFGAF